MIFVLYDFCYLFSLLLIYENRWDCYYTTCVFLAAMAELVDALDSGSSRGNPVDVRVILAALLSALSYNFLYYNFPSW